MISKINKNNNFLNYIEYFKLKFLYKDSLKNILLIIRKIIYLTFIFDNLLQFIISL